MLVPVPVCSIDTVGHYVSFTIEDYVLFIFEDIMFVQIHHVSLILEDIVFHSFEDMFHYHLRALCCLF